MAVQRGNAASVLGCLGGGGGGGGLLERGVDLQCLVVWEGDYWREGLIFSAGLSGGLLERGVDLQCWVVWEGAIEERG